MQINNVIQPFFHITSGARALAQSGEDAIAGLRTLAVGVCTAAQGLALAVCVLREGYAQGILSGRGTEAEVGI